MWGPRHNGGGNPKDEVEFEAGESITGVDMDKRTHWGFEVQQRLSVKRQKGLTTY